MSSGPEMLVSTLLYGDDLVDDGWSVDGALVTSLAPKFSKVTDVEGSTRNSFV
jgi:hypothetical protein